MRHLILFSTILLLTIHAGAQTARKTRTITTSFSRYGTSSGDTSFFNYNSDKGDLQRFFWRNLRVPFVTGTDEMELGTCTLYFIVDTAGKVSKAWCDSASNKAVEKEVLRVAGMLTTLKPTTIKGKPVFTKVKATVNMEHANEKEVYGNADILIIAYDPQHRKTAKR